MTKKRVKYYFAINIFYRLSDKSIETEGTAYDIIEFITKEGNHMSINAINGAYAYEQNNTTKLEETLEITDSSVVYTRKEESSSTATAAVIYEKGEDTEKSQVTKRDTATIEQMKADAEQRTSQLRTLVEKMLIKQGQAADGATSIWDLLRSGKLEVDSETAAQAQADVAEDGYWGVEQTSDRLVSFAKALAGNDSAYADTLIEAMKKGFEEATKSWGDDLPELCKKTLTAAIDKMEKWRDGDSSTGTGTAVAAVASESTSTVQESWTITV